MRRALLLASVTILLHSCGGRSAPGRALQPDQVEGICTDAVDAAESFRVAQRDLTVDETAIDVVDALAASASGSEIGERLEALGETMRRVPAGELGTYDHTTATLRLRAATAELAVVCIESIGPDIGPDMIGRLFRVVG